MGIPVTSVDLDGVTIDSVTIADLTINYGRSSVMEQPQPSTLSLTLLTDQAVKTPTVGMPVTVEAATVSNGTFTRFTGWVTAVSAGKDTTTVTATSYALGRLARLNGADYVFDDGITGAGANIDQLLGMAGVYKGTYNQVFSYDAGTTTVIPGFVVPAGNVLAQCQQIANTDVLGVFYETPAGVLKFSDSTARAFPDGATAAIYFATAFSAMVPSPVIDDWRAESSLDTLINSAQITYGAPSRTLSVTDTDSVGTWGLYATAEDFPVIDVDDASRRASRLVAGWSMPRTTTNPISIELAEMSDYQQSLVLGAEVGTSVGWLPSAAASGIPGLPEACFIEGWTERIVGQGPNFGRHTIGLVLSDVALTRTMQTWAAVTAALKWSAVGATVSWIDLAGSNI